MIKKYQRKIAILLIALLVFPMNIFSSIGTVFAEDGEDELETVYHENFEEEPEYLETNGDAEISWVDIEFEGNENGKGIEVTRSNHNDGIDLDFDEIGLEDGKTYTIKVLGYVDEQDEVEDGAQALLQDIPEYNNLYLYANLVAGESFTLCGQYTADTSVDEALRIQSNDDGALVDYYIVDILIQTEVQEVVDNTTLNERFEVEPDYLETNGDAEISWVDIEFEGNENGKGIEVTRSNHYDGIDLDFDEIGLEDGKTYTIKVLGYVDEQDEVEDGAQALLQDIPE